MNKNLGWKVVVIVVTLLVFVYGIFGIPESWTAKGLLASLGNRIHLGLDLKGGTHLILQVQVNDAVNVDSDNALERLKTQLRSRKINYAEISKPDPTNNPDQILIKGVPPEQTSGLRSAVDDNLPEYTLTSGAENTWTVAMKLQALAEMKRRAVSQAIETIRNRIDQLGVSEPVIEEHGLGQYQILVQLPGVDDPGRVKEIMPWDLSERLARDAPPLVLDVREPEEFAALRIAGSINVPRGVLEQACEWDFDFTVPRLAAGRDTEIVVLCRSGTRSLLAADAMQQMGFARVASLRTGLRGWNDFEQPLIDATGERVDIDAAQALLSPQVRADQRMPRR